MVQFLDAETDVMVQFLTPTGNPSWAGPRPFAPLFLTPQLFAQKHPRTTFYGYTNVKLVIRSKKETPGQSDDK